MSDSTFSRVGSKSRGNGYTMVPHWLWTADLPPGAKVLIGWLHSHSDAFLAKMTMNQCRRAFASSQVPAWFDALEEAGLVAVERAENGKAARVVLDDDAWNSTDEPRRNRRANRADIGAPTAPKSARTEEQGEEQGEESSLRSDEDQSQVSTRTQVQPPHQQAARDYYDWHKATRNSEPVVAFTGLMSVAKALIAKGYTVDEVVAGMQGARAMNAKSVQDEISRLRRVAAEATGPAIPAAVVKAFGDADTWLSGRGCPTGPSRQVAMEVVAWFVVTQSFGVGEAMLRLAVALRGAKAMLFPEELRASMWRAGVDRFPGTLADYPDAMERAYRNQWWRAQ